MVSRRQFNLSAVALAFAGLNSSLVACAQTGRIQQTPTFSGFGPLVSDPNQLLDLPEGFSYRILSQLDDMMDDGLPVPDRADGMGCFQLDEDRISLVRNHELKPKHLEDASEAWQKYKSDKAYDNFPNGVSLPGGTSNLVYNLKTQTLEKQHLSLVGTIRNCAGGVTPWNTWLTCEESVDKAEGKSGADHGYIFEVPADAQGLVDPVPLKDMGRFNHEAAAVDPDTGIVYLTEDRGESLFYRFIPTVKEQLAHGGQLQALVIKNAKQFDSRNWRRSSMKLNEWLEVEWINLDNPESPEDDLRLRGYVDGAAVFARGEGIHLGQNDGINEFYFCCTNGGAKKLGQIMRYQPSKYEGQKGEQQQGGRIQLFLESSDGDLYNYGDNITVTPQGHLLVCEDQYTDTTNNHLQWVTSKGEVCSFAKLQVQTEPAGVCFSQDGSTLFVNLYSPTKTLAITGPWDKV